MSDFEKEYYESEQFWAGEAIQDENNLKRFRETAVMIPADAASLADIGCGNGLFVNYLQTEKPALKLMGVDRSNAALKYVKTDKQIGDIAAIPLANSSYDCVTCLEVIEHLPVDVYGKALAELARVSGKYVIISVPYAEELEENQTQCPQCKTIFNADLHLRNFSDSTMQQLMQTYGFECVSFKKAGEIINYKGHYAFRKKFYPEQFRLWRSPICPVCGFRDKEQVPQQQRSAGLQASTAISPKRSMLSYFTGLPKLLWPKEKKYFWIIALYKKI